MQFGRRNLAVYALLAAVWALVVVWQAEEHVRVRRAAKAELSSKSRVIANTVSACIRGMRFRGAVLQERLEPVLDELVNGRTNSLVKSSELLSLVLLNAFGETVASAGRPVDFSQRDLIQQGERWGQRSVVFINPVDLGASLTSQGITNPTVVLPPPPHDFTNRFEGFRNRSGGRREPPPPGDAPEDHAAHAGANPEAPHGPPPPPPERDGRPRRPFWLRGLSEADYESLLQKKALHGLVVAMSTDSLEAASTGDFWLRMTIASLATLSALGCGLAWRNMVTSSDLQIRLVRASELNSHLKEMNLAAAGLAHETRNPLNIIRGLAQMISKQGETTPEMRQKSRAIIDEADKVAAQLNEFINYSRPREVRRSVLAVGSVVQDVARALSYDLEEKHLVFEFKGESLNIEADEQLLRQALFNLILNAIQAVEEMGVIQVLLERRGPAGAVLEVRDNGPGVPPERRTEIFKPYFTTQAKGTGLGLAVVQQIVLAHGWEIDCLPNEPKGAVFRLTHLRVCAPPK